MSALTITIGSTRSIGVDGRLVAGETAAITVSGATPAALYLVNSDRAVVAACETFADGVGTINLATTAIASIVSEIPAGRMFCLAALITDGDGETVGYGFIPLVSAPMPDDLEELDIDWYVTATQIAAAFDADTAYAVGDLCSYEGRIYKCTTAHPAGAWDADDFEETLLADLLGGASVTVDDTLTASSTNPVKSSGIWAHIWGALTAIPDGAASLYAWVGAQLAGKAPVTEPVFTGWRDGDTIAAGDDATVSGEQTVALGRNAQASNDYATAVGAGASAYGNYAASLGSGASAAAENSVQLGPGTNEDADTLQFMSHTVVDASGLIPYARMPSAVTQHVSDTTIHVTSADKTAWNAKADTSDIPTVNDAALTIQKNGTTVATFTANDADAVTANITVPTATSDLANDSGFIDSSVLPSASSATPAMDGTASAGLSPDYARGDHVHPVDTTRAAATSLAAAYDATATYAVGDYRTKDGVLYKCTTAIATAEAWTAAHWTAVAAMDEGSSVTVDSALSSSSENPVQNKVINTALAGKADAATYGYVPWANSDGNAATIGTRSGTVGAVSLTVGNGCTASGANSVATGFQATASGVYAHAEGAGSKASGWYAHAEGSGTTASGDNSHAEGYLAKASGVYSHAEGYRTSATLDYAHAEGSGTTASGYQSHAEGIGTTASGNQSHAEGYYTTASSFQSHAEGYSTTASGNAAHAEGSGTYATASTRPSHAEGVETTAAGTGSHSDGYRAVTAASGSGTSTTTPHSYAYAWQGDSSGGTYYHSHGNGTYNINPAGGVDGLYIGEETLPQVMRYPFAAAAESSGAITIADRTCNATTAASGTAYTITCAASEASYMRDAIWTLDCTALSTRPSITWSDDVTAANEDTVNLRAEAGKICVFFITEPISGRFIVARQLMEAAAS